MKKQNSKTKLFTNNSQQMFYISKLTSQDSSGITLVALVVTIIVLLILAGVTIVSLLGDDGIIAKAQRAAEKTNYATQSELEGMEQLDNLFDDYLNGNNEGGPVTNPYDPEGWDVAWTCTDETWSDMINSGEVAEGDIVAKFYKTGNKITPPAIPDIATFLEGDEYKLVIEGQGNMGILSDQSTTFNAWQSQTFEVIMGSSTTCIMPYVTEVIICDGITNISDNALAFGTSLKNVTISESVTNIGKSAFSMCLSLASIKIPNSVTNIGLAAFSLCTNLSSITLPNRMTTIGDMFEGCSSLKNIVIPSSVTSIGNNAFVQCGLENIIIPSSVKTIGSTAFMDTKLKSIVIPDSVTNIGENAFQGCSELAKVKILTTDATNLTVGSGSFSDMAVNSTIYVLSEEIKTKLEGTYNSANTTVQVVSEEEMDSI